MVRVDPVYEGVVGRLLVDCQDPAVSVTGDPSQEVKSSDDKGVI